jgi:hypothetical protein
MAPCLQLRRTSRRQWIVLANAFDRATSRSPSRYPTGPGATADGQEPLAHHLVPSQEHPRCKLEPLSM